MTTTLANPDNATYYQDTAFEAIPHIRLGTRIDEEHPAYFDLVVNPPINNVALAELSQGWRGLLIEFDEDDIAEYRENDVITDPQCHRRRRLEMPRRPAGRPPADGPRAPPDPAATR